MEMKDKLEKAFNEALGNHELPYDAVAWNAVKKQLPAAKTPWYWMGGAAALVLAVGLGVFLYENEAADDNQSQFSQTETMDADQAVNADLNNNNTQLDDVSATDNNQEPNVIRQGSGSNSATDAMPPVRHSSPTSNAGASNQNNTNPWSSGPLNNPTPVVIDGVYTVGQDSDVDIMEWLDACKKSSISGMHNYYCQNTKVILFAHQIPDNAYVTWLFSDGTKIKGEKVEFKSKKDLKVRLELTHKKNADLVYNTEWKAFNVIDAEKPVVESVLSQRNTKNYVELTNTNPEIEHLVWRIDNKVCQEQTCGAYLVTQGTHNYTVESYDKNGCFASVSGSVEIQEDYNLYVENSFSPNGDGNNDVFLPEALKLRSVNFKMTIFDRNGKILFVSTEASQPWDGTSNGQALEIGSYIWSITLINEEGLPEQYRGVVNLVR